MVDFDRLKQAVHVTASSTAPTTLHEAFGLSRDQILINEDPIYVGPAPATADLDEWRTVRERFIRDYFIELPHNMYYKYSNNWLLLNVDRLGDAPAVIVWAANGLPEHLLLAWMVFLFDRLGLDIAKLQVVQLKNSPSGHPFRGLGEIGPEQIRTVCPPPRRLRAKEMEELRRAWTVYTSSDPADLANYAAGTSSMPMLHEAISQLIDRYPDHKSGLNIWDEMLLRYTAEKGPKAASVIGAIMAYHDRLDYVYDDYLFARLTALGRPELASLPIAIRGSSLMMRECGVALTPFGEKVLAGEANHVKVNGIDDWVGGVHLSSAEGMVTFRAGDSLVLPR